MLITWDPLLHNRCIDPLASDALGQIYENSAFAFSLSPSPLFVVFLLPCFYTSYSFITVLCCHPSCFILLASLLFFVLNPILSLRAASVPVCHIATVTVTIASSLQCHVHPYPRNVHALTRMFVCTWTVLVFTGLVMHLSAHSSPFLHLHVYMSVCVCPCVCVRVCVCACVSVCVCEGA